MTVRVASGRVHLSSHSLLFYTTHRLKINLKLLIVLLILAALGYLVYRGYKKYLAPSKKPKQSITDSYIGGSVTQVSGVKDYVRPSESFVKPTFPAPRPKPSSPTNPGPKPRSERETYDVYQTDENFEYPSITPDYTWDVPATRDEPASTSYSTPDPSPSPSSASDSGGYSGGSDSSYGSSSSSFDSGSSGSSGSSDY